MKYDIHITEVATGITRIYHHNDDPDWERIDGDYVWPDGNYGCDCNRALFFARAGGEEDIDIECGEERFSVCITARETGEVLYRDNRPNDPSTASAD